MTVILSCMLVFTVLVYVYPLKLRMTVFFYWMTNGWLPSQFSVSGPKEIAGLVIIYSLGFSVLSGIYFALYLRVQSLGESLGLNRIETLRAREEQFTWCMQTVVALLAALFAAIFHSTVGFMGGFFYFLIPVGAIFLKRHFRRQIRILKAETTTH